MSLELDLFGSDLVSVAVERLKFHEPKDGYYVAFSGGKDSIVMYEMVKKSGVKYDAVMHLTTVDPPELIEFVKKYYPEVKLEKPLVTMWGLIVKKQYPPTRLARYCCEHLKERGGKGRVVVTGVRRAESNKRKARPVFHQCHLGGKQILNPIVDWGDDDVWDFIKSNNLPYPSMYDNGYKRIGCIGCPMSYNQEDELNNFPKFKRAYILAFDKMIEARNRSGKETQWKNGEEVMEWWVGNNKKEDLTMDTLF